MPTTTSTSSLPHWQLESIYPGLDSQEFAVDKRNLAEAISELEDLFEERGIRASTTAAFDEPALVSTLEGAIQRLERVASLLATVQPFVNLRVATDAFDERSQAEASALRPLASRFSALVARFKAWVAGLDLDDLAARSTAVRDDRYQLERHQREAAHLLPGGRQAVP